MKKIPWIADTVRIVILWIMSGSLGSSLLAASLNPDFTRTGSIAALKANPAYSSRPYSETYNLGATGLRGWIYLDTDNPIAGSDGLMTSLSRQILVTVASLPASTVLQVDDVILGAKAASNGPVTLFSSDCRKEFGLAIGDAENDKAGTLRVARWRAGTITEVNISIPILGNYTATAPYSCPKSARILANARTKLVNELLENPNFLTNNYGGAINGLALLAGVAPNDANYSKVQSRLQAFARSLAVEYLKPEGMFTWEFGYMGIFLSEYYLRSLEDHQPDEKVLLGVNRYAMFLARVQGRYGTFGHGGSDLKADGSLHGTIPPYGPVNSAGLAANIAIVMAKKALVAGHQVIDSEIDPAIQRAANFFGYYVNKGSIPYGEHEPWLSGHNSNGKDAMCAVLFGMQGNRPVEAEYFTRMIVAGYTGREYGHSGQGFSYLWEAIGANMGGPLAVAKYLEKVRWYLDLARRSDGSFTYDGQEQYGGGKTEDGSYLGKCGYHGINPTASYILSYALPLRRLYITGRNATPEAALSAEKITNAIAAATIRQDCPKWTNPQLIAALSEYDPVVRNDAAIELATRSLSAAELEGLIHQLSDPNPNGRMGACQILGLLKNPTALPLLSQRLSDSDLWVRAKAATALRCYGSAASEQLTPMLQAFVANSTDPENIVWADPVQIANNYLSFALFGDDVYHGNNLAEFTIKAPKNLLYPALRAGLKQPDSNPRTGVANFVVNQLTLKDVQALALDLSQCASATSQADTMWSMYPRCSAIATLAKFKIAEAMPLAVAMQSDGGWGCDKFHTAGLNALGSFGDSARWTLPALRQLARKQDKTPDLTNTIDKIEQAITSPVGMSQMFAVADSQVLTTKGAKAITLSGSSCRETALTFSMLSSPSHGVLSGTAPNLTYKPAANYIGPDHFSFQVADSLTTSEPATVSILVGGVGAGLKAEYFENSNFTNLKVSRTDSQLNFDGDKGFVVPAIAEGDFSVSWSGLLLIPETGTYTFSMLNREMARLYVDGLVGIESDSSQPASWKDSVAMKLSAGQIVDLHLEHAQSAGSSLMKLKWSGPSFAGRNGVLIAKEWLDDGEDVIKRKVYGHAQSLKIKQNKAQPIMLTGSGATQKPLAYAVTIKPSHGRLKGTAPKLIYIPSANFSGADSFTFLVSNGTLRSTPVTVAIEISAD